MIEVQGLTKRYGTHAAVEEVTFSVGQGEIVGFLGPNGAGKTTTMRVLTGFLPPSEGSARVAGHDIVSDSRRARANTGYLPESAALYPEMRVREYLGYRARLEGIKGTEILDRVEEIVGLCLLDEVADKKVENLSRGYRQRTALAGSLVHQPPVLILDEPTVGLDPAQIIKIREMIRVLGRERAVLLSTHILPEVDAVCDRVLIIDRGRIVAEGTPEELRRRLSGTPVVRAAFRGAVEAIEPLANIPGVVSAEETPGDGETRVRVECVEGAEVAEEIFRLAVSKGWVLRELSRQAVSLEDVFVRLTHHEEIEPAPAAEEPLPSEIPAEGEAAAAETSSEPEA
jgi:ABC-2 type transport system ATP-binding protein